MFNLFGLDWLFKMIMPIMFHADGDDDGGGSGGDDGDGAGGDGDGSGDGDGDGGSGSPFENWYNDIPEEYATDPSVSRFKDQPIDEVFKSLINAKKMVGKDKVVLPGENASEDELSSFYKKLGMPESHDEYELTVEGENIPEGFGVSKEYKDSFMKSAHKAGLSKKAASVQWNEMLKDHVDRYSRSIADVKTAQEEGVRNLKNEWGSSYEDRIKRAESAVSVIEKAAGVKLAGINLSDPSTAKALSWIGSQFSEDQLGDAPGSVGMTPREAKAEIKELQADPAYFDKKNPKHKLIADKVKKLYKYAHPDEK